MDLFKAVILGLIQGVTEFLPVSSSGHLVLGQALFGLTEPELTFDITLHAATLGAVFLVFRREIGRLIIEFVRLPLYLGGKADWRADWRDRPDLRMLVMIVVGTVPTGIIGVGLKDFFESLFSSTMAVGLALLFTGTFLFLTRYAAPKGRGPEAFRLRDAFLIGLAQGLAITPGISRSGFTISTGLFTGLDRETAARFSFLLFIPAVSGALLLQILSSGGGSFGFAETAAGFAAAFLSGLLALTFLLRLVRRGRLHLFSYYCWAVGLITLTLTMWNN